MGVRCTYGDDRSLTNFLLKAGYTALYSPTAIAYTFVPNTFSKFMKQQFRWKKSWVRESLIASTFIWKRNPIMSISYYIGIILPLLAPIIVLRAIVWYPLTTNRFPYYYLFGLTLMAIVYGLYYRIFVKDNKWVYGVMFASFYTLVLIWQLPWAILNLRDSKWGTR
jgi:hyaluronan synthase